MAESEHGPEKLKIGCHKCRLAVALLCVASRVAGAETPHRAGPTLKVQQLTGDFDRERQSPTLSQTESRAGVAGTDLGSSFMHKGRLCFLFGDTFGRAGDPDCLAFADITTPGELRLEFVTGDDGKFLPIAPSGIAQAAFCVPSCGISLNNRIYAAYTGDVGSAHMSQSHLIRSDDDGRSWTTLYQICADDPQTPDFEAHFINTAFAEGPDGTVWMWGSGKYRESDLFLARTRSADIEKKEVWTYYMNAADTGGPRWVPDQSSSQPLFHHPVIGEFSCAWIEPLKRWVLLYNSAEPRGIAMRVAVNPWGPWSEVLTIFDPGLDGGYGHFMHIPHNVRVADDVHDPQREHEWGGEYGPYLIPSFATGNAQRCELYYTMSTWNPYQVVLMRSVVKLDEAPPTSSSGS